MRIAIAYPPLESDKGVALLTQNRQFQWFSRPTYIFPVVPATAATMLKNAGHEVLFLDGIAAELTPAQYTALNRTFQKEHLLYAARVACEATHEPAPKDWDSFKAQGQRFFNSKGFWATLAGIYTEIVNPILPAVYSEAVDVFADTVEVGFG